MKKHIRSTIPFLVLLLSAAPALTQSVAEVISIEEVPLLVLDAVREVLPEAELVKAMIEITDEGIVYVIDGILDGEVYEIEVTEEGVVLEVELKDDDDIDIEEGEPVEDYN